MYYVTACAQKNSDCRVHVHGTATPWKVTLFDSTPAARVALLLVNQGVYSLTTMDSTVISCQAEATNSGNDFTSDFSLPARIVAGVVGP